VCASPQQSDPAPGPLDSDLMERLKSGDMSALEVIYMRYSAMIKTAIHRVSPDVISADVEELTQDIFISLIKSAPSFDQSKKLKPWIYGIAVKKASNIKRTGWLHKTLLGRHRMETEALCPNKVSSPSRQVELRNDLAQAFETLPKEQHEVMILHAVEGFEGEEIAEILGIKVNTVWTRLHRARKTLSENLKAFYKGADLK
jgi:RNA polymerase sigma factor (sigma-70 family)